jgi:cellulose synthase/poly-beta-1,6-N-acetylglucosamine synthase-like glycosyltransferase
MNFADGFVLILTIIFIGYFAYATPIIMLGIWRYKKHGFASEEPGVDWDPPNVSILVPVKNEEKVVGRLLDAITRLDYPRENLEVIVVEDESKDRTLGICKEFARQYPWIKVFHRDASVGKGNALNFGFAQSTGEIIATFDADDIPEPLAITKALRYFSDPKVGAVHGYHRTLNLQESIVARLAAYETFLYRLANDGKYALKLFVAFSGSNTFFRRTALERVGLWDANSIVEDAELAVRFARAGIPTKLAPVESWQEMPAKVRSLLKQRIRWSGGNIQTGLKHWDAWKSMSPLKAFDMEVLMMSPVMAILAFVGWALLALGVGHIGIPIAELVPLLVVMGALNIFYFGTLLTVVVAQAKTGIVSYLTLILATYPYATLLSVANFVGLVSVLVLGRKLWLKTEKTGYVDSTTLLGRLAQEQLIGSGREIFDTKTRSPMPIDTP